MSKSSNLNLKVKKNHQKKRQNLKGKEKQRRRFLRNDLNLKNI
jgi:hypothetical protein